jgi:hypothetical protein
MFPLQKPLLDIFARSLFTVSSLGDDDDLVGCSIPSLAYYRPSFIVLGYERVI